MEDCSHLPWGGGSPEGTQEGNKEDLPSSSLWTAATPQGVSLEETQGMETQATGPKELRCLSKE